MSSLTPSSPENHDIQALHAILVDRGLETERVPDVLKTLEAYQLGTVRAFEEAVGWYESAAGIGKKFAFSPTTSPDQSVGSLSACRNMGRCRFDDEYDDLDD